MAGNKPGPESRFTTLRHMARMFRDGWSTYDLARLYDTSQFLTWKAVDTYVPLTHPRRRGRRVSA